ncbi:3'-5' exonuclease [Mesorhizobium sp. BR115XR7A]|uniref:3'-5' exonuclease n=1 Tax=Mesorhizobium sp. BR115XR7A TaxID=2876645 RepID=UPI001CCD7681|nr:3'-5' exonuclease [Mesorhizobium sp. BR115XR7A]MBZ9905269.1 3'-5' exonuclease [Mesorhizobium sp. BR115XR7A]MBZ9931056.1 3'-5' exonuclease [Mesorhizobium sp. BR1-1-5]
MALFSATGKPDGSDRNTELEAMAKALNSSGRYRVLRRLEPRLAVVPPEGTETRIGLFVDVETTGLDPTSDEIIELAMLPFTYGLDGTIFNVGVPFQQFREPSQPIPAAISALTGITDEMVAGQAIAAAEVAAFVSPASLVIAHNAAFDRRFLERLSDAFITKPWACSMTQIDWAGEGFEGTKLAYLATGAGFFYERHRAFQDCAAAVELLSLSLPKPGIPAMSRLLERARLSNWRIWAENSPFGLKDVLKARGYRWNAEGSQSPRSWYIDVDDDAKESELSYLRTEIYRREVDIKTRKITAYDRFSDRS